MKPPEILGMIEEAAGTRMFETKKQSALKTMDKKQTKVDEINSILTEEITPTLEKLRGEKGHYLQWSAYNTEVSASVSSLQSVCACVFKCSLTAPVRVSDACAREHLPCNAVRSLVLAAALLCTKHATAITVATAHAAKSTKSVLSTIDTYKQDAPHHNSRN
jgi:hypothetical protein